MAAPKGILALVGGREPDEDEGGEEGEGEAEGGDSPKARAMRDLKESLDSGDFDAAGHAFERAYMICKQGKSEPARSSAEESEEEEY